MESQSPHLPNFKDETAEFAMFSHEKLSKIISVLRISTDKSTAVKEIKAEIENMPGECKVQMLTNLRCASFMATNEDIVEYIREIIR